MIPLPQHNGSVVGDMPANESLSIVITSGVNFLNNSYVDCFRVSVAGKHDAIRIRYDRSA